MFHYNSFLRLLNFSQTRISLQVHPFKLDENILHHSTRKLCKNRNHRDILIKRCMSTKYASKMSAWQIHQFGSNDELTLSDKAHHATIKSPNELLIKVHAASVNPIDFRMREGYGQNIIQLLRMQQLGIGAVNEFPLTLGRDFSGTVVATGQGVKKFKPGDEVWGALSAYRQGTHAEFTVASESEISRKPLSLSHTESASIPYVAVTAWTALCSVGELTKRNVLRRRVLIQGGSGGIGTFSIQLMKAWGAHVTTTCATDAVDLVTCLGADVVVDYKTQDARSTLAKLAPYDFILDAVGGDTTDYSFDLLKKWSNAKIVTIMTPLLHDADTLGTVPGILKSAAFLGTKVIKGCSSGRHYRWAFFIPNGKCLEEVSHLVEQGQIDPVIEKVFPFSDMPAAFQHVEKGHTRGKTVVQLIT